VRQHSTTGRKCCSVFLEKVFVVHRFRQRNSDFMEIFLDLSIGFGLLSILTMLVEVTDFPAPTV
jgi:hypothetical protein